MAGSPEHLTGYRVRRYLSSRLEEPRRALVIDLAAVTVLIAAGAYGLQPLLRALIDLPFAARVVLTVALLAPVGIGVGIAMPIGLRCFSALHPTGIPYAWGVNGIASVVASVLGMAVAISFGFCRRHTARLCLLRPRPRGRSWLSHGTAGRGSSRLWTVHRNVPWRLEGG